jgi:hypothetical protein
MTIATKTRLLPHVHGRLNPFKRLAAAMISQRLGMLLIRWAEVRNLQLLGSFRTTTGFLFGVLSWEWIQIRLAKELSDFFNPA